MSEEINEEKAEETASGKKLFAKTLKQYLDKDSRIKKVIFNVFKDEDLKIYNGLIKEVDVWRKYNGFLAIWLKLEEK